MRYVCLLNFVAVVHGAADVALLAHSMRLVVYAASESSQNLIGNDNEYFDATLRALVKKIEDLKASGQYTNTVTSKKYGTLQAASLMRFSKKQLLDLQNDSAIRAQQNLAEFVELLIKNKEYIERDRGVRRIGVIEQWKPELEGHAMSLAIVYALAAGAPVIVPLAALEKFVQAIKKWSSENRDIDEGFSVKFDELKRMIDVSVQGDVPDSFFKRAVRFNDAGWFIIMPIFAHEDSLASQQKLGVDLKGWRIVDSLNGAKKIAQNLVVSEDSFLLFLTKILDKKFSWVMLIAGHGDKNITTCGISKVVFEDIVQQLNLLKLPLKKLIVSTCYGGSQAMMKFIYGDVPALSFDVIIPTAEEGEVGTDDLLAKQFLFFVDHPYYRSHLDQHLVNEPRVMLIRYAGNKNFVLFDPWNRRTGERPDAPFYAPAVPWMKGMAPEFVHPAARVR